jgi:hypothetical protein
MSANNYGTVQHNGTTIRLTQGAYFAAEQGQDPYYAARGIDAQGNEYRVTWQTTQEWDEHVAAHEADREKGIDTGHLDEGNACDWDNPDTVELL